VRIPSQAVFPACVGRPCRLRPALATLDRWTHTRFNGTLEMELSSRLLQQQRLGPSRHHTATLRMEPIRSPLRYEMTTAACPRRLQRFRFTPSPCSRIAVTLC